MSQAKSTQNWRGGLFVTLGAISFGYAFLQRVAPSAMVADLMQSFSVGAAVLGNLSALYFYAYAGLQLPIGALVDRWGPRIIISSFLLIAGTGSLIFSLAETIEMAYFGRLLVGIGSGAGLLGTMALAAKWFPPHRFAFLSGAAMFIAMMGGFLGQGPFAALVTWFGWRACMLGASVFGIALAVLIWLVVRDDPAPEGQPAGRKAGSLWAGFREAVGNREVWALGIIASACSGPMLAFSGLWGVPYLVERYDLARPDAAFYTSLGLIGWAIGAPLSGWLSDALGRRKLLLVVATGANLFLVTILFYGPDWPLAVAVAINFTIGFTGASVVNCYAFTREIMPPRVHGAVVGFVNMMTVSAGAILQPAVGVLLDWQWQGTIENGVRIYSREMYDTAFASIAIYCALGLLATLFVKETFCKPRPGLT